MNFSFSFIWTISMKIHLALLIVIFLTLKPSLFPDGEYRVDM
jgi:hypothetical protein